MHGKVTIAQIVYPTIIVTIHVKVFELISNLRTR